MKLRLILNRDAGTMRGLDPEAAANEIAGIFRDAGHELAAETAAGSEAIAAIRRAFKEGGVDAVVIGGGDGTVSAAAAAAAEAGVALGILPLGTMNFFARSLGTPAEMKAAATALAAGTLDAVDIGSINGRTFVHTVSLGLHPAMVEAREKLPYNSRYGKMLASVRAFLGVMRNHRRFNIVIVVDGRRIEWRTAGIVISNNPLGEGHLPYADDLTDGLLAIYVTTARGWLELARVTASAALGTAAKHPLVEVYETEAAEIRTRRHTVSLTIDGELLRLAGPLKVESLRGGLKVLRPRPDPQTAAQP